MTVINKGVLITGGLGFIAGHLIKQLLSEGFTVYAMDNQPFKNGEPCSKNLIGLRADISDESSLNKVAPGLKNKVGFVIHLAAMGNRFAAGEDLYQKVNIEGTKNVFRMTHNIGCEKFIFASSVDAVGPCEEYCVPVGESFNLRPIDLYGRSKRDSEMDIAELAETLPVKYTILRFGNVYGENNLSFIKFIADALATRNLFFLNQTKDVRMWHPVFIDDLVDAIVMVVQKEHFNNQIYHLTGNEQPTNKYLTEVVAGSLGYSLDKFSMSRKESSVFLIRRLLSYLLKGPLSYRRISKAYSNSKIKNELGFSPSVSLKDGVPRVIRWAMEQDALSSKPVGKNVLIVDFMGGAGEKLVEAFSNVGDNAILATFGYIAKTDESRICEKEFKQIDLDGFGWDAIKKLKEKVMDCFSKIDIVVFNGCVDFAEPFSSAMPESINALIDKTVKGSFWVARAFTPIFLEQKSGQLINIVDSDSGNQSWTNTINEAIYAMCECLRNETMKSNIKIGIIFNEPELTEIVVRETPPRFKNRNYDSLVKSVLFARNQPPQASVDELKLCLSANSGGNELSGVLRDKVVLITGASQGLGKTLARQFVNNGAIVIAVARNKEKLDFLAQKLNNDGGRVITVKTDISCWEQVERLRKVCIDKFGKIDILINNAAAWTGDGMDHVSPKKIDEVIDTSLKGPVFMAKAFLPHFKAQKQGHIVNISALTGKKGHLRSAPYTSVKRALGEFSGFLKRELFSSSVNVTCVYPGSIANFEENNVDAYKLKSLWGYSQIVYRDVAKTVLFAVTQPFCGSVQDIVIRPVAERIGARPHQLQSRLELYAHLFLSKCKLRKLVNG